jgi:hypothetical protein
MKRPDTIPSARMSFMMERENYIRLNRENVTGGSNSPTINSILDKVLSKVKHWAESQISIKA